MVDLGCGNGTQTRFLADRFTHVVGADLSAAALDHARLADPAGQATYRLLDAAEKTEVETLHAELGDANVYMRGVLHQVEPDDRQPLVDGLATLVGDRGRAFLVELAEAAGVILRGLAQGPGGPPAKLAPVFRHGIAPGEVARGSSCRRGGLWWGAADCRGFCVGCGCGCGCGCVGAGRARAAEPHNVTAPRP
jgi:SAM-dependent methyltransferase